MRFTDPQLKAALQASLRGFRDLCMPIIKQWQADGVVASAVEPGAVAQLILSICLGFVAQHSLTGDADVQAHADALAALVTAQPAAGRRANRTRSAEPDPASR